jgi:flavin reductase (DIM6/NTAB) family NADH-FMN oxidoreductase RutF
MVKEVDYFGLVSGHRVPDKFEKTGLKAQRSSNVNARVIEGSPLVIECELIEFVETDNFTTVLARIVNLLADESILNEKGKIDSTKINMVFYDSFSNSYFTLGEKVGDAFKDGKHFI